MQRQPHDAVSRLRRLLKMLRAEIQRIQSESRASRTLTTDKPQPDDDVLAELGQGEWRRFIVNREERN